KAEALKTTDAFQEQYQRASAFATSIRAENTELEKRVKIAEGQVNDGLEMVRQTFELRVKALEMDVKSWRTTATFLIEKDKRTDMVRERAAQEPELRARCENLKEQLK
ncbi:hypothetical protein C8J56DRAFT_731666, partial [Mycena floridula]